MIDGPPYDDAVDAGGAADATTAADDPGGARRSGLDIAREALAAAKAEAKRRGLRAGNRTDLPSGRAPASTRRFGGRTSDPEQRSGPHPDERDPQLLASSLDRLLAERGWQSDVAVGAVLGRWGVIVGRDVAEHSEPVSFERGQLVVQAQTTAWATELRLLAPALIARLNEELGSATVTAVKVLGPQAPSWSRGRLRVRGRGARDTYG